MKSCCWKERSFHTLNGSQAHDRSTNLIDGKAFGGTHCGTIDADPNKEETMNTQAIHEVTMKTEEGKMTFPQVIHELTEAGVKSYFVDLAAGRKTYYMADDSAYTEPMILKLDPVAGEFLDSGLVAAIRGAQADAIR
jgi:hypothetical protein